MSKERKSIRLTNYDYSSEGVYFITICTENRHSFFGRVEDSKITYSEIGLIAHQYWLEIPNHFSHVELDDFVIMPNHIHGILNLDYSKMGTRHGVSLQQPTRDPVGPCHGMDLQSGSQIHFKNINQFSRPVKNSVSVIINQYKSSVKRWCNKNNLENFKWQPRFYEHIVRNSDSLDKIREYIGSNVLNWDNDDLFINQ